MGKFNELTCSNCHRCQGIFCNHGGNACLLLNQGVQAAEQGTASCHDNAPVKDIGRQFRRGALQHVVHRIHYLKGWFAKGFQCLVRGNHNGLWKACYQIASPYLHGKDFGPAVCGADVNLNFLSSTLTDKKVVLFPHVAHQGLVKVISGNLDGCAHNRAAQGNDRDIGRTAADIHYHVAAGLADVNPCADGRCYRLLDDGNLTGACLVGCILHCLFLNFSCAAGDADTDSWLAQRLLAHCLADKVF